MVGPGLPMQSWTVAGAKGHNAFTDLTFWQDEFWLVYFTAPTHLGSSQSQLILLHSPDARAWEQAACWKAAGAERRDPKLAVIGDRLFVYALENRSIDPKPCLALFTVSADGKNWSEWAPLLPDGWLCGKPQSVDGKTWYAPAHNLVIGNGLKLLRSGNGMDWDFYSDISAAPGADETAIAFTADSALVALTRMEPGAGLFGGGRQGTLVSQARLPYTAWGTVFQTNAVRLDSPALFSADGVYAIGRSQPYTDRVFNQIGSAFSRKRTSLFRVGGLAPNSEPGLIHLADFPSSGDTAYAGVVLHADRVWVSYYTSDPARDDSWIVGMFRPTQVQMASFNLADLASQVEMTTPQ